MPGLAPRRMVALALLTAASAPGCYRHHLRHADAGPADAGLSRCGAERCALADPARRHVSIESGSLVGAVEGDATGLRAAPEVDGVAFELDPCAWTDRTPCPQTITVAGVGADLADPAVLAGAVETSIRDRMIVVRADPCPGCDDGHVAAQLLFAAGAGEPSPGFDLDLAEMALEEGALACESRGRDFESSGRFRIGFTWLVTGAAVVLDEGETERLPPSDFAVRLVRSSFECVSPDLPPPRALALAEFVVWSEGPF